MYESTNSFSLLNEELTEIKPSFVENRLLPPCSKTHFVTLNLCKENTLLNGEVLAESKKKSSCVSIDRDLRLDIHVSDFVKNLSAQIFVLSTLRQFVTRVFLFTHYKTYMERIVVRILNLNKHFP